MDAAQRIAYLDAMGVTMWQPRSGIDPKDLLSGNVVMAPRVGDRHILPIDFSRPPEHVQTTSMDSPTTTAASVDSPSELSVEPPIPSLSELSDQATGEESTPPIPLEDDPDVLFTAMVKYHPKGVALIDVCQHELGHQRAHHELCQAVLHALCGHDGLSNNEFVWPVVNMPRMDRRRSKARSSTKAFLSAFGQRHDIALLLCLGDSQHTIDSGDIATVRLSFSMTDLLQGIVSKREAWQQLRGFIAQ